MDLENSLEDLREALRLLVWLLSHISIQREWFGWFFAWQERRRVARIQKGKYGFAITTLFAAHLAKRYPLVIEDGLSLVRKMSVDERQLRLRFDLAIRAAWDELREAGAVGIPLDYWGVTVKAYEDGGFSIANEHGPTLHFSGQPICEEGGEPFGFGLRAPRRAAA